MTARAGRLVDRGEAGDAGGQHPQHGEVAAAGQQRLHRQQRAGHRRAGRGDQHQLPAVHRVGDRAAEQAEDDQRHERDDRGDADQQRRAGQRVDLVRDGDQRHLLAEHRGGDAARTAGGSAGCAAARCRSPSRGAGRRHRLLDRRAALDGVDRGPAHGARRCTIQPPPSASSRTNRSRSCSRSWPPCQNSTVSGHDPVAAPDRRPRHRARRASARRAAGPARRAPRGSRRRSTAPRPRRPAASRGAGGPRARRTRRRRSAPPGRSPAPAAAARATGRPAPPAG